MFTSTLIAVNVRDRAVQVDIGLGAVFAAALAFQASRIAESWGGGHWVPGCAAGTAVCVIALARRRERCWAAAAGAAVAVVAILAAGLGGQPAEPGPAMALALAVLVGSAVRALPVGQAVAVAGGGLAVAAGALAAFADSAVPILNALAWVAAVAAGMWPRYLAGRSRAAADRIRRDERLRLARELHDVVAHHITGIILQAQAAQVLARRRPEEVEGSLAAIEAVGAGALAATRRVVGLLRDAAPGSAEHGSPGELAELVDRFDGRGAEVTARLPSGDPGWPPEVAGTVYRVVQESLTNIARHAPGARSVVVGVAQDAGSITVEVTDDAPGPVRAARRAGHGLIGMRERLEALGGTLRAGPADGCGWSVVATLPLRGPR
ncbi:two-component sensor histidine kinase [Spongiactinospora gelatinilytica]|uniref:histidine kinase n=1 Tax=Spongiactinospora gelatinilytica TaxID=2666298 RepID=A0A2W2HHD6_9ACTN|nr:sensor histidine kinase [Spongiactinospora gelatinilytica]PZG49750.1 two-component sensor histidine kinase [Spongiactinospora gelatinilytica]